MTGNRKRFDQTLYCMMMDGLAGCRSFLCLVLVAVALAACGGGGDSSRPAVAIERAYPGLSFAQPIAMLQVPGESDSWFVLERAGRIWRFENREEVTSATLVADLAARVSIAGEGGALGLAFHPQFTTNGRVFLSYTAPGFPLESRLSEFVSNDGGASLDPGSERVLLTILQDFGNHNGGHVAFGLDGLLYFGLGDGGSSNDPLGRAQDTTNLLGALLRIDVDAGVPYAIPQGNPFAGNPLCVQGFGGGPCPEIYAWGLRNPWRWSFDTGTGQLWLADVGQNDWEEINLIEPGGNYGWPIREGAHCNPNLGIDPCPGINFIDPVAEYGHDLGRSITGGYVYRGSRIVSLSGAYVVADYVSGRIWRLEQTETGFALDELLQVPLSIVSFAQDTEGELYVLDLAGGGLYRLVDGG